MFIGAERLGALPQPVKRGRFRPEQTEKTSMAKSPGRVPSLMRVSAKRWITPNMIRVTCRAEWMKALESGIEGAHFKLFLPKPDQSEAAFARQLADGPRPDVRTYTIRHLRAAAGEIDVDFVDHGDAGPASAWAR